MWLLHSIIFLPELTLENTAVMTVPSIELNDGNKMPQVGFGLWKVDNATCANQVYEAIKAGYRLFDGACGTFQGDPGFAMICRIQSGESYR